MLVQELAHLAELGEHQGSFALVLQVGDQLVESRQLAGSACQARTVFQCVCRVVAHLLEPHERGQHQAASAHPALLFGVVEELVDDLLIQRCLLFGELGVRDLLDLVGQVGQESLVGFGPAEDERLRHASQPRCGIGVMVTFDWRSELVAELGEAAEQAGVDRVEDGPQFAQPVLDRRASERQLLVGGEGSDCLGGLCVWVLDHLGFVEDDG